MSPPVQICGRPPSAYWWDLEVGQLFVLLDEWKSSPGEVKENIFSTNFVRLSRQETVHLVEHSRANLQKWSGSGLNVTRLKTHTSPLYTILYSASQHV